MFAGLLQGATLTRRLETHAEPLHIEGARMLAIWMKGILSAGVPVPVKTRPVERAADSKGLIALDVRPLLARGIDPLDAIIEALDAVGPGGVLKITAPFRPAPLIALLTSRGHAVSIQPIGSQLFGVEIVNCGRPEIEDLRDLEPPLPMERVLGQVTKLAPGGVYLARVPRHPRLLFPHLRERGLAWAVHDEHDGSALLRVVKPA
jgi:uncharacterized protein (DUF2249 family)